MAIGDAYATAAQYRAAIERTDASDDTIIDRDLKAVSRYLDWKLRQPSGFNKDAAATTRLYVGNGEEILEVDPIASTAGLEIKWDEDEDGDFADESAFAATDYELHPLNAGKGPEARPWTSILLPPWSTKGLFWPLRRRIQVTAIHGWPAVPEAITSATITLTAIVRVESPYATAAIQEIDRAVEASPQARAILRGLLQRYNRYPVVVA